MVAVGFVILVLGLFGKYLRKAQGRMNFAMESGYSVVRDSSLIIRLNVCLLSL